MLLHDAFIVVCKMFFCFVGEGVSTKEFSQNGYILGDDMKI